MNIFDKRPLSLILCIWLGGFVFFSSGTTAYRVAVLISAVVLLTAYIIFLTYKKQKHILIACAAALLLSSAMSHVTFDVIYNPGGKFEADSKITATVVDISYGSYSASLTLKTDSVNGEAYKNRRVLLRLSSTEARDISVGDILTAKGTFADFHSTDSFDSRAYYFSDSICAEITDISELRVSAGQAVPLSWQFENMREYIRRHAVMMSNESAGNLASALLFGVRDSLSPQTRLDFTRIGISHLLALSGLHLAVVCLGIAKLLSLLRVGKKTRYLISVLFVILYMAFTGFSSSVVRAGLMLTISYTLFLFAKTHDSITSLITAVSIICLVSPFSIYDTSLWLSAFATLGIIIFAEAVPQKAKDKSFLCSVGKYILEAILSSVFAVTATLFITTFTFNTLSILSPITTLIFSLLTEIIMYLGAMMLIIGKIIPIGKLLIPISDFTIELASLFAKPRFVQVSTDYAFLKILIIIFTIVFFLFAVLKIKNKRVYISAIVILFVIINASALIKSEMNYNDNDIIYTSKSRSDSLLIKSGGEVCLINCAAFSKTSARQSINLLNGEHINQLDAYIVTGYTWTLSDDICSLISSVSTRMVYVPTPRTSDEADILEVLFVRISEFSAELIIFNQEEGITCGDCDIYLDYSSLYGDGHLCALRIYNDDDTYTYLSSGMTTPSVDYPLGENIETSDVVIFGGYGSSLSDEVVLESFYSKNKIIVIDTKKLSLGDKAYIKYKENGCEILSHPSKISILLKN